MITMSRIPSGGHAIRDLSRGSYTHIPPVIAIDIYTVIAMDIRLVQNVYKYRILVYR